MEKVLPFAFLGDWGLAAIFAKLMSGIWLTEAV